ncbi:MAG: homoserine dehydrogenase, partial [Pseudomonadota bacterium]
MGGGKPVVIKFAASVLNSQRDLPLAVTEIYRYVRQGKKVVAIVSALDGETDRLRAAADDIGAGLRSKHSAGFAALGEAQATYALAIACDHVGLSPHVLEAKELHLTAEGDFNDAWPTGVCDAALSEALQKSEVAIVPGYVGVGPDGRLVLLGRGGADLTTIVVAHALGVEEAIFLTDADGLFDRDPLTAERLPVEAAKRYKTIPWTEVRNKAPGLIQDKALQYAENNSVRLNVMAPGALAGSKVGAYSAEEKPYSPEAPNRVAVAGLGVVGEGAALKAIFAPRKFELVA